MQLYSALFTGGKPPPWEWTRLQLCRDVYHCTPNELDDLDWEEVQVHLRLLAVESRVRAMSK